jgi:hypothetical protein
MDGGHLEVEVVEVAGGSSSPHSHPCPVIAVVVEGTIRTQVKGEPEAIYKAGQASMKHRMDSTWAQPIWTKRNQRSCLRILSAIAKHRSQLRYQNEKLRIEES